MTDRSGIAEAAALRAFSIGVYSSCKMLQIASLSAIGCENIPNFPVILSLTYSKNIAICFLLFWRAFCSQNVPSKCFKRGQVYQVEENLRLFGSHLPCSIQMHVLNLYSSKRYSDNVLAVMFSVNLGSFVRQLIALHNQNVLLEVSV